MGDNQLTFKNLIGNNSTKGLLERQLQNNTFNQFTVFEGMYGTGKSTTAKLTAMRLTCENPDGAEPCCQCQTCKNNLKAFRTNGESASVKIVNFGKFLSKEDVTNLIKEVFVLKTSDKPVVYIFEEVHVLKDLKGAQTAFLEEIDRMPPNVYIIMCTTRAYDVIPELMSRALKYRFTKLTYTEAKSLILSISGDKLGSQLVNLIIRHSDGIPRNIIKNTKFVLDSDVTAEEYKNFVQDVDAEELCMLLQTMLDPDIKSFAQLSKNTAETIDAAVFVSRMNELLLNALFALKGVDTDLSEYCLSIVKEVLTVEKTDKCLRVMEKITGKSSESEVCLALYRMRLVVQDNTLKDVYSNSVYRASEAKEAAKVIRRDKEMLGTRDVIKSTSKTGGLTPVNVMKLNQF